jgi:hypothetical protein
MALIHILRADAGDGRGRVEDDVDESLLVKTEGVDENDNEIATSVEYRFPHSDVIVHRSVHVQLKRWPEGMGAVASSLT